MPPLRKPLHHDTYDNVIARVTYQYILRDLRRFPRNYSTHPPSAILELANRDRKVLAGGIYWALVSAAKWNAMGVRLTRWRDELSLADKDRALHKRKPRRR